MFLVAVKATEIAAMLVILAGMVVYLRKPPGL